MLNPQTAADTTQPPIRFLTDHQENECNCAIAVRSVDQPGAGGAHHEYEIEINDDRADARLCKLSYQNGPIAEVGVNGITEQALLAVVLDRLRSFQNGPYACRENAIALTRLEECLFWFNKCDKIISNE